MAEPDDDGYAKTAAKQVGCQPKTHSARHTYVTNDPLRYQQTIRERLGQYSVEI
jgi:hypothetical protein